MLAASFLDNFHISPVPFLHNVASVLGILLLVAFVLHRGWRARVFDPPGRYILLFLVVTALMETERFLSGGGQFTLLAVRVYLQYVQVAVLALIVFDLALDPRTLRMMSAAFLFSTTAMSLVANLRISWMTQMNEESRVGVVGVNLNGQAFLYALGFVGVLCWILVRWPRIRLTEIVLCGAAGSMLIALVNTASRGGAAALLVGIAAALVFFLRRGRYSTYLTIVPVIVLGIAVVLLSAEVLRKRTEAAVIQGDTGLRVELTTTGGDLFRDHPVTGWGAQYSRDLGSAMGRERPIAAHNLYMQMLLSFGLMGFLPWLAAVLWALRVSWRARWSFWGAALLTLWLMTLTFGIVGNLGYDKHFWLLLALAGRATAAAYWPMNANKLRQTRAAATAFAQAPTPVANTIRLARQTSPFFGQRVLPRGDDHPGGAR